MLYAKPVAFLQHERQMKQSGAMRGDYNKITRTTRQIAEILCTRSEDGACCMVNQLDSVRARMAVGVDGCRCAREKENALQCIKINHRLRKRKFVARQWLTA
jgi:hypothetical protein